MNLSGPSLLDLQLISNVTTTEIAYMFTTRSAGDVLGAFTSVALLSYHINIWVKVHFLDSTENDLKWLAFIGLISCIRITYIYKNYMNIQ